MVRYAVVYLRDHALLLVNNYIDPSSLHRIYKPSVQSNLQFKSSYYSRSVAERSPAVCKYEFHFLTKSNFVQVHAWIKPYPFCRRMNMTFSRETASFSKIGTHINPLLGPLARKAATIWPLCGEMGHPVNSLLNQVLRVLIIVHVIFLDVVPR